MAGTSAPGFTNFQAMQGGGLPFMRTFDTSQGPVGPLTPVPGFTMPSFDAPVPDEAPRLSELKQDLERAEKATKLAAASSGAFVGIFARFTHASGYGHIACSDLMQHYKTREVQVPAQVHSSLSVGDTVVFKVTSTERGIQANFARRVGELTLQRQRILEAEAPLPAPGAVESAQEYIGFVTSFAADPGFGFISCAQTRQMYGNEVYIHRDQFTDLGVGDAVRFRVALNPRGVPVARGVRKAVTGTDATPGAPGALKPGSGATSPSPIPAFSTAPGSLPGLAGGPPAAPPPAAPPANSNPAKGAAKAKRSRSRSMSESMSISQSPPRTGEQGSSKGAAAANGGRPNDRSRSRDRRRRSPSRRGRWRSPS